MKTRVIGAINNAPIGGYTNQYGQYVRLESGINTPNRALEAMRKF